MGLELIEVFEGTKLLLGLFKNLKGEYVLVEYDEQHFLYKRIYSSEEQARKYLEISKLSA
jgi:hypothetical protein